MNLLLTKDMDRITKYFLIAASSVVIFHGAILPIYVLFTAAIENASAPGVNPSSAAQQCLALAGPMPLQDDGGKAFQQWEKEIQDCYAR